MTPAMALVERLHRFTLGTLHLALQLRAAFSLLLACLWSGLLLPFKHKGDKLERITADAKRLAKLPLHLALIVQEEEVWPEELARLVAWAFAVGVRYVSLYDHSGRGQGAWGGRGRAFHRKYITGGHHIHTTCGCHIMCTYRK